jgi:hypothetical protein
LSPDQRNHGASDLHVVDTAVNNLPPAAMSAPRQQNIMAGNYVPHEQLRYLTLSSALAVSIARPSMPENFQSTHETYSYTPFITGSLRIKVVRHLLHQCNVCRALGPAPARCFSFQKGHHAHYFIA